MSNRTSNHLVVILLSFAAAAAGCGTVESDEVAAESVGDVLGTAEQAVTTLRDPCLTQAPDKTLLVPTSAEATYSLTSGSGYYAYRTGCTYFIADVEMTNLSNCGSPITPDCRDYLGFGAPYDLPSSLWQSYGDGWPTTAEDCNHFTVDYRVYLMPAGSQTFTQLTWVIFNGSWDGTTCAASLAKHVGDLTVTQSSSDTGFDTYRFLTRVKERSSYQETQAFIQLQPPK